MAITDRPTMSDLVSLTVTLFKKPVWSSRIRIYLSIYSLVYSVCLQSSQKDSSAIVFMNRVDLFFATCRGLWHIAVLCSMVAAEQSEVNPKSLSLSDTVHNCATRLRCSYRSTARESTQLYWSHTNFSIGRCRPFSQLIRYTLYSSISILVCLSMGRVLTRHLFAYWVLRWAQHLRSWYSV